jgi:ADP-dependent phosphofructokinase/glucokinase
VNWDTFVAVNDEILRLIESSEKAPLRGVVLDSVKELMYALHEASQRGGKEYLASKKVYDWIDSRFKNRPARLGGTGLNMGSILLELGLRPLVSYPCRSERLMQASPNFAVADKGSLKRPIETIRREDEEYDHIVFEFKKGRLILSWDPVSSQGRFDYDFLELATSKRHTDVLVMGYAHLLLPRFKERTDDLVDFLDSIERPRVHIEFGGGSIESMKYAMKKFAEKHCSDSWGFNEKECVDLLGAESESLIDVKDAAVEAVQAYDLSRICVHSDRYAFSASRYDPRKEVDALMCACLASSSKTLGKIDFERARKLPVSDVRITRERIGSYNFCLVPTLQNENPRVLTGLGDSFAAVQAVKILT